MPGARGSGERRLERALAGLAAALDEQGAPWMIIGGIALIARGVRRMTGDIDAVVRGDAVDPARLMKTMKRHEIVPRIRDAEAFARANLVFLLRHAPSGVDLDVSLGWTAFEIDALAARARATYGRVRVPMASVEDLLVFKAVAARPKDLEDAAALLALYPAADLTAVRERLTVLAALAEEPALVEGLERAIVQARSTRKGTPQGATRRRRGAGNVDRRGGR